MEPSTCCSGITASTYLSSRLTSCILPAACGGSPGSASELGAFLVGGHPSGADLYVVDASLSAISAFAVNGGSLAELPWNAVHPAGRCDTLWHRRDLARLQVRRLSAAPCAILID